MGRRTVLLVAAVVVAALGTALIFAYVNRTDERALKDQRPVQVLVAKTLIKAGTTGAEAERLGAFKLQVIPQSATIAGYLTDTRPISALVAVGDIFPGEQIIPAKFVAPGGSSSLTIPAGKMAISVQLGDPERVAGFVQPGSEVAVFVTFKAGNAAALTRILLTRVTVIAVGPTSLRPSTAGQGNTEPVPTAILTLALDQRQAEKLVYAASGGGGGLYFALLNKDSKVAPGPAMDVRTLFA